MINRKWALVFFLFASARLSAQTAAVEGVVTGVEDSSAIANALVRLQSVEGSDWVMRQQRLTNAGGRFHFFDVAPGSYRVQLLRIGYQPAFSETARIAAGSTVRLDVRAPAQPIVLSTVRVFASSSCLSADQLAAGERIAELWREARKGVETRRAFEHQYSFTRTLRQDIVLDRPLRGQKRQSRSTIFESNPDSVDARDARRREINRAQGYASSMTITMPDEKEVLDDDFLTSHCLETDVEEANGAFALRFRPVRTRSDIADVRGRVWIDAATYQVRRLEVEYLRSNSAFANAAVDYSDVIVGGTPMRLPRAGVASLRPGGLPGVLVKRATSKFIFEYDHIQSTGK